MYQRAIATSLVRIFTELILACTYYTQNKKSEKSVRFLEFSDFPDKWEILILVQKRHLKISHTLFEIFRTQNTLLSTSTLCTIYPCSTGKIFPLIRKFLDVDQNRKEKFQFRQIYLSLRKFILSTFVLISSKMYV